MNATTNNPVQSIQPIIGHTPTPWEYRPWEHDDWGWIRGPKEPGEDIGPLVALARSGQHETLETRDEHRAAGTDPYGANAAFIVEAVNNYDRLTERCEAYKGQVEAGAAEIESLRSQLASARKALEEIRWSAANPSNHMLAVAKIYDISDTALKEITK